MALLWPLVPTFESVRHLVVMDDGKGEIPSPDGGERRSADPRLRGSARRRRRRSTFRVDDENRAASMCYTSGTTGNPKGVVYSHRSTFLHTLGAMTASSLGVTEADRILPVVPMFHANAWGLAHAAVAAGADARDARTRPVRRRASPPSSRRSGSPSPPASRRSGWACCPSSRAATRRRCGPSRAAGRRCPGRCRRATASRPACRSCRPGA